MSEKLCIFHYFVYTMFLYHGTNYHDTYNVILLHYIQFDKLHKITDQLIYDINMNNNCINIKTYKYL